MENSFIELSHQPISYALELFPFCFAIMSYFLPNSIYNPNKLLNSVDGFFFSSEGMVNVFLLLVSVFKYNMWFRFYDLRESSVKNIYICNRFCIYLLFYFVTATSDCCQTLQVLNLHRKLLETLFFFLLLF